MSPHTNPRSLPANRQSGNTTIIVLGFIVVISMAFGAVLTRTMNSYRQVSHIASWQESMVAAESGSEIAMTALRNTITDPVNAFAGWSTTDDNGDLLPHNGKRLKMPKIIHPGEGNSEMDAVVTIDAPTQLLDGKWRQWYRIRSVGTTYLPGGQAVTGDKRDSTLRKLSFHWNSKTDKAVTRPQTSRVIELLAKPISFENAIVSDEPLIMNNQGIYVDSYDSRYTETSTNGLYDASKAAKNGDIATNSELIEASFAKINGDAFTDQGKIVDGANITGEQRDDFSLALNEVNAPTWWPSYQTITGNGSMMMPGGPRTAPTRYKMNNLKITGNEIVTFGQVGATDETYIELWITGDFATSGNGTITVLPKTNVKFFLEGNIDIGGGGTMNKDSQPGRLQIMCVNPPPNQTRQIKLQGNGVIVTAIYGPGHDVIFGATGNEGTMWGAITGKSIEMGGKTVIHYDEALAEDGYIVDYRAKSWFEDTK